MLHNVFDSLCTLAVIYLLFFADLKVSHSAWFESLDDKY